MNIIVRYGPAPGDTLDENGNIDAKLPGHVIITLTPQDAVRIFGDKGDNPKDSKEFVHFITKIWQQATTPQSKGGLGAGHIMVGCFTGFDYLIGNSPPVCGFVLAEGPKNVKLTLTNYVPLYAIARIRFEGSEEEGSGNNSSGQKPKQETNSCPVDIAIDYRKVKPGKSGIKPFRFPPES